MNDDYAPECGWVIFDHPSDYPSHYVVRMFWAVDGQVVFCPVAVLCDSLEEAREQVPATTLCVPRDPTDSPVIIETWM